MSVDIAYDITGAKMFFPPDKGSTAGQFSPADMRMHEPHLSPPRYNTNGLR